MLSRDVNTNRYVSPCRQSGSPVHRPGSFNLTNIDRPELNTLLGRTRPGLSMPIDFFFSPNCVLRSPEREGYVFFRKNKEAAVLAVGKCMRGEI